MENDLYVILIIITIISFILIIVLNLFFIYLPAQRAASKFDDIARRSQSIIDNGREVADDVNNTATILDDFFKAFCIGVENNNGLLLETINDSGTFVETCEFILS